MTGKIYRGRIYVTKPIADRFWPKVCVIEGGDDCWLWTGCKQKSGYGRIGSSDPSKPIVEGAHRIAYELQCGPIPSGMQVLHRCDVPACCRGSHLFLGTHKDNMDDRDAKGRATAPPMAFGENAANSILSESQVRLILASKDTHKSLGRQFGVATSTIKSVRDGTSWAHVGEIRAPFGRDRRGEEHGRAKLTEADVIAIRTSQRSSSELAREYGINGSTLAAARWGDSWKHLAPSKHDRAVIDQVGEKHHAAKLTAEAVRAIRASAEPARIMADRFGVSPSLVSQLRNGKGWTHVE